MPNGVGEGAWGVHQANICDEHIGLLVVCKRPELRYEFWVWNWKRGIPVMVSCITLG